MTIKFITGIPRSGTTLCCHILNQQRNMVALHEPLNPNTLGLLEVGDTSNIKENVQLINSKCHALQKAIFDGLPFEHGDKGGLDISNPVGLALDEKSGRRIVEAKRGEISLPQFKGKHIELVIKQNALFTAYLQQLMSIFPMLGIVRNPVDVLLSWWTVDLPVSRGRLPAGENNNAMLKQALTSEADVLQRQLIIYQWFVSTFLTNKLQVVKYEDIVESDGAALTHSLVIENPIAYPLSKQAREYSEQTLSKLAANRERIIALNCAGFYSADEIAFNIDTLLR